MSDRQVSKAHKKIGVGIIRNSQGKILIDRRRATGEMGGLWEFPGGKIEPGETIEDCIRREIKEELGIDVSVEDCLSVIEHEYSQFKVTLFIHYCQYIKGKPRTIECDEIRWVSPSELDRYTFPEANYEIITLLQSRA